MKWTRSLALVLACLLTGIFHFTAFAGTPTQSPPKSDDEESQAAAYFTDVVLIDQDGRKLRFYSDLLKGKVVLINTIFTTCTGICPVMARTFSQVQEHLGARLGKDVHLISISVDPETDTPNRLKEFGSRFGARPGWHFLTGAKQNVDFALAKLGQKVEAREDHKALMLVGNEPTGLWKKAFGLADPIEIIKIVDSVIADQEPMQ